MGLQQETFEFDNKELDFKLTNQSGEFLFYKSNGFETITLATKGYNLKLVDKIIIKGNKTSNGFGETIWVKYQKVDTTSLEYFKCILSEVRGISNKMIGDFFEEFKTKENFINALKDKKPIKGIGLKKRDLIIKKLETAENENLTAELAVLINNYDWAAKISKKIGSMEEFYANPYHVLSKLVSFKIADSICREKLGVSLDNKERNKYLVEYKFNQFNRKSSNYIDKAEFIDYLMNDVESKYLHCSITDYVENNTLIISEGNRVYKKNIYLAESEGAKLLAEFETFPKLTKDFNFEEKIQSIEIFEGFELAESQKNAISEILFNNNISALIGGAGTGKSTITKFITKILENQFGLLLLAPTGVAGVRMTECTEKRANTIHSFIYSVNNFIESKTRDDYYIKMRFGLKSFNCLIIDETSMVSQELLYNLLKAMKDLEESSSIKFKKIIFIGDEYQLPSVGSGQILKDIIDSGKIKIVKLTETFRQSKESLIIKNAKKVRSRKPIDILRTSEFFVAELKESMIRKVFYRFNEKYTDLVSFYKNFQIASTTNKTKDYINNMLKKGKGKGFQVDDKVINLKNDGDKGIYNGDKGIVRFVDDKKKTIHIEFYDSGAYVEMKNPNELGKTLDFGYCCTIHKLQGLESKAMMIILEDSIVTDHRLLYTAITRSKENCIILARSVTEINNICQKSNDYLRKTTFKEKIRKSYKYF